MPPDMHQPLSDKILCIYCRPVHSLLFGEQVHMTTKLIYLVTVYYAPDNGFKANDAALCKNKVG